MENKEVWKIRSVKERRAEILKCGRPGVWKMQNLKNGRRVKKNPLL